MMNQTIEDVIALLNNRAIYLPSVQVFMLMARVQRAAELGNIHAQRYVRLCELNVNATAMH